MTSKTARSRAPKAVSCKRLLDGTLALALFGDLYCWISSSALIIRRRGSLQTHTQAVRRDSVQPSGRQADARLSLPSDTTLAPVQKSAGTIARFPLSPRLKCHLAHTALLHGFRDRRLVGNAEPDRVVGQVAQRQYSCS